MRRHRGRAIVGVLATAAAMAATLLTGPATRADVPEPYYATSDRGSDPHMIKCLDPETRVEGYCLYTSEDMGQSFAYPPANYYPMFQTRAHFSPNGVTGWVDKGVVFSESTLVDAGWVPSNAFHLWAPSVVRFGVIYYLYVPDVASTSDTGSVNVHNSSRIAVAIATNPFGPFRYAGTVTVNGYMSDPDALFEGTSDRTIVWANGDASTCGGLSSAKFPNGRDITPGTAAPLTINGVGVLGNCGGTGHPYMEGPSIYKVGSAYRLFFAAKPTSTPPQCAQGVGGPNTANSVIAWATATSAQGPYTYQGIVMCGSTTEWTNQATVATVSGTGGSREIIVYHDSPADIKIRRLHAECLFSNPARGIIGGVFRQALTAANGFNDCLAGVNHDYYGWYVRDPQVSTMPPLVSTPGSGTAELRANRYAVGPWERYRTVPLGDGLYSFRSLANGRHLCTPNTTTPITASCDVGASTAVWRKVVVDLADGTYVFQSVAHNRYLSVGTDGRLYADSTQVATAARITELYPGGNPN
ncbi:MAG: family 43 glycosylhydrolase [Frankia sp.]|nr:family 43 glycosylhydrolase [Frankia sp.]